MGEGLVLQGLAVQPLLDVVEHGDQLVKIVGQELGQSFKVEISHR